jgi:hypothetical protein
LLQARPQKPGKWDFRDEPCLRLIPSIAAIRLLKGKCDSLKRDQARIGWRTANVKSVEFVAHQCVYCAGLKDPNVTSESVKYQSDEGEGR